MNTITDLYLPKTGLPKYRAVAQAIEKAVRQGVLTPGDKLPPVRDLAWRLGITPGTVARAYSILTESRLTHAEVGRGTFVADPKAGQVPPPRPWVATDPVNSKTVSLFSPRLPDVGQVALIHESFARQAQRPPEGLLNYPSRASFEPARRAVLRWLEGTVLGPVDHQDLVLSHGGQSGISLVMQAVLRGQRPVVLVEDLSYPGFRRAAQLLRAEVVGVPMDKHGLLPEALDRIAQHYGAQMLCTSPEVHNPTGLVTPIERREAIAAVALRRGLHVLEDDCYRLGRPTGPAFRALLPDLGWHVSSISKILTPALRIGCVIAPRPQAGALRRAAEHGFFGLARPLADLTEDLLTDPRTYALMDDVRTHMARYVRSAVNILGGFDLRWHEDIPFLWLTLPEGWRAARFVQDAEAQDVQLRPAEEFALRDGFAPHAVRLAINGQVSLASFEAAIGRLRVLLDNPPERISV